MIVLRTEQKHKIKEIADSSLGFTPFRMIYTRELIIIRCKLKVSPELGTGNIKGQKNLKKLTKKITKKLLTDTDKSDNYNINYIWMRAWRAIFILSLPAQTGCFERP